MGTVRAKPATGFTLDGKPRKRAAPLKKADIPRVQELIDSLPIATYASLSRAMGREETAIRVFCMKYDLLGPSKRNKPVRATGLQGRIFAEIDRKGLPLREVAEELQMHATTVGNYRAGRLQCSGFILECLAEIAGYRLVLAPLSEVSSQDGQQ